MQPYFLLIPSFPRTIQKNIQTELHPHHLLQILGPVRVCLVFPSHTIQLSSLSLLMPTKTWYITHSGKRIGYISTKHHSAKRSKGSFEKSKGSGISIFSFKSHSLPLLRVLSHLFLLQDKKAKPQKLIKPKKQSVWESLLWTYPCFSKQNPSLCHNHKSPQLRRK